jgi:hypothetical protein
MYTAGEPDAVTIGTVPFGKSLSVMLTHDVDFTKSMANAVTYAQYEKSQGLTATYFVQTKYIREYNDDIFFDDDGVSHLRMLAELGMEIGSHTVAHSKVFNTFSMGTGAERYPSYTPFVKDRMTAYNGTILARTIHEYLLQRPILSPGAAFLVRSPRRTASTPASPSLARSRGGLRSQPLRDGIHE